MVSLAEMVNTQVISMIKCLPYRWCFLGCSAAFTVSMKWEQLIQAGDKSQRKDAVHSARAWVWSRCIRKDLWCGKKSTHCLQLQRAFHKHSRGTTDNRCQNQDKVFTLGGYLYRRSMKAVSKQRVPTGATSLLEWKLVNLSFGRNVWNLIAQWPRQVEENRT